MSDIPEHCLAYPDNGFIIRLLMSELHSQSPLPFASPHIHGERKLLSASCPPL